MYEAIEYAQRFGDEHPLIVVTSAIHMPRAMQHFNKVDLHPVAAPTAFLIKQDKLSKHFSLLPGIRNLTNVKKAMREYIGAVWGKLEWRNYLKQVPNSDLVK